MTEPNRPTELQVYAALNDDGCGRTQERVLRAEVRALNHELGELSAEILIERKKLRDDLEAKDDEIAELKLLSKKVADIGQAEINRLHDELEAHRRCLEAKDAALELAFAAFEKNWAIDWNELDSAISTKPADFLGVKK